MQERQEKMSQNDIIKLIQVIKTIHHSKREKKLADKYYRDIAKTVIYRKTDYKYGKSLL